MGTKKLVVYFFNIDIMYVLKARLFQLQSQFKEKLEDKTTGGNFYECPKSRTGACTNTQIVSEIEYESRYKTCVICDTNLVPNKQSTITNEVE